MNKKSKTVFVCSECGYISLRWLGKCTECGAWDSFEEQVQNKSSGKNKSAAISGELIALDSAVQVQEERIATNINELNRVLGGGIVSGSVVMIGGDPGIGKSTLMLQMLNQLPEESKKIYISGEESFNQIRQRAGRLSINGGDIYFLNDTNLENVIARVEKERPHIVIIDSIQTLGSEMIDSIPGNTSQLRFCTSKLVQAAKQNQIAVFLVGHVTKEGAIAGPKILEHIVDTVLYFEGDTQSDFRILRTTKNRFGAINEIALFRMGTNGLVAVSNPSELFLNMDQDDRQGTAVVTVLEGNRPMLVEVQALVTKTQFGLPQRTATGIDHRRMNLLLAVLDKKCGKPFGFHDVFIKTAAGLRLDEPAADLGICMALVSSLEDKPMDKHTVFIGEVGLSGELRPVQRTGERLREAERLGFTKAVMPDTRETLPGTSMKVNRYKQIQQLLKR
jgi:DNA repair protein RadA/Sms